MVYVSKSWGVWWGEGHAFSPSTPEAEAGGSEFEASLVYTEFQDS